MNIASLSTMEWEQRSALVTQQMEKYVGRFVTPLSMSKKQGWGQAWGSGTYLAATTHSWILTAAHVIDDVPEGGRLAHLPRPGGDYNAALGIPDKKSWPIDAAMIPVHPRADLSPASKRQVAASGVAQFFDADPGEVLFCLGFPGFKLERNEPRDIFSLRTSDSEQLTTPWLPILSQVIDSTRIESQYFDRVRHVGIRYPSIAKRARDNMDIPLPNPAGMSGSALWDTKYVKCLKAGMPWDPMMAQICGVVWFVLDEPEVVLATKIEFIRSALSQSFV